MNDGKTCKWKLNETTTNFTKGKGLYMYDTGCGETHASMVNDVTTIPKFKFCPYCGRLIEEIK